VKWAVTIKTWLLAGSSIENCFTLDASLILLFEVKSKRFSNFIIIPHPTAIGLWNKVLALAREGMSQGDVAGLVGLTHQTVYCILQMHAMTGSL
jgi:hypothetical protein